jgi:hypothetical protein
MRLGSATSVETNNGDYEDCKLAGHVVFAHTALNQEPNLKELLLEGQCAITADGVVLNYFREIVYRFHTAKSRLHGLISVYQDAYAEFQTRSDSTWKRSKL